MKNLLIEDKLILRLTFNPALALTALGFRGPERYNEEVLQKGTRLFWVQFEFTCLTPPVFPALVTGVNSNNGNLNCEGSTLHEDLNTVAKEHRTSEYLTNGA